MIMIDDCSQWQKRASDNLASSERGQIWDTWRHLWHPHRGREGAGGQKQTIALQSVPLSLTQGFVKRFFKSSTGRLAIPQLLSSQARSKMLKELLKRNKDNLNVRPSGARCNRLCQCYSIKRRAKIQSVRWLESLNFSSPRALSCFLAFLLRPEWP